MTIPTSYGNYYRPFAEDSPWNVFPVNPVLGTYQLPASSAGYSPVIQAGEFSTGVFLSKSTDTPMTIYPLSGREGVWEPDSARFYPSIEIPFWPADTVPASGSDGHADIVDHQTGIIHSFWQLRNQNGKWCAAQYAWSRVDGKGWGDSSHYYQGARAAGVPSMAGLIRKHEAEDGDIMYRHALCMSLPYEALVDGYIYPATSSDETDGPLKNTGKIPEGALMMLPADYDTASIINTNLRKVAETLKTYGAYVVDRNGATPFILYVEEGSKGSVWAGYSYTSEFKDLNKIREALRQVISADSWVTHKPAISPMKNPLGGNLLSLRGEWKPRAPATLKALYNMYEDSLDFPATTEKIVMENLSGLGISKVTWAALKNGDRLRLTIESTNGVLGRIQALRYDGVLMYDGPVLLNGQSCEFTAPTGMYIKLYASNQNSAGKAGSIKMSLVKL